MIGVQSAQARGIYVAPSTDWKRSMVSQSRCDEGAAT
jgi:hypothetical protein